MKSAPWYRETHKTDRNPSITNHDLLSPLKQSLCFLRGPLIWLTAAKNANVSSLLNFRIRVRSGPRNRTRDLPLCNQSAVRTELWACRILGDPGAVNWVRINGSESFQEQVRKPLGCDSFRTSSTTHSNACLWLFCSILAYIALLSWSPYTKKFTSKQQLDCSPYLSSACRKKFLVIKYFLLSDTSGSSEIGRVDLQSCMNKFRSTLMFIFDHSKARFLRLKNFSILLFILFC